jgi:multidrug efflux pump subunit AcrA (membrane-fusion protein)
VALAREPDPIPEALLVGAILTYQRQREALLLNFYVEASRGRPRNVPPSRGTDIDLVYSGVPYRLRVFAIGGWSYRVSLGDRVSQVTLLEQGPHQRQLVLGDRRLAVVFSEEDLVLRLEIEGRTHRLLRDLGGKVRAPAPALVIEVLVAPGDRVREGERLGLLEAMKSETAFYSPLAGTVREVCVRPGARVVAGEVILVIEPASSDERLPDTVPSRAPLELPEEEDPLETLFGPDGANPDLGRASACAPVQRAAACAALRTETRRILMGYDVNPERAEALLAALNAPVEGITSQFRAELASLARSVELFGDIEWLFSRTPTRPSVDALGPSNDARMAMYLRRIDAEGAGIAPDFLAGLRRALAHYDIDSLAPDPALQRALLRLYATRTTKELRDSLVTALLGLLIRLAEEGAAAFARYTELQTALDRLALLRETVAPGIADLALQAHFLIFERSEEDRIPIAAAPGQVRFTLVPPPSRDPRTAAQAAELGLTDDEAERLELWRLSGFDLERIETRAPGVWAFFARARAQPGDERLLCFAEIHDLGPEAPSQPDLSRFERRFHEAIEAMRHMEHARDPARRLHWNRLTLFVRPPVVVPDALREQALRRLAPETGHLGLEKIVVRLAHVDAERTEHDFERHPPEMIEVVTSNPTGSRVEVEIRAPHDQTLAAATPYERRVAAARARGLVYPYEVIRLFTSTREDRERSGRRHPAADRPSARREHVRRGRRCDQHPDPQVPRRDAAGADPERSDARPGRPRRTRVRPHRRGHRPGGQGGHSRRVGQRLLRRADLDGERDRESRRHGTGRAKAGRVHRRGRGGEHHHPGGQRRGAELLRRPGDDGPAHAGDPDHAPPLVDGAHGEDRTRVLRRGDGRRRGRDRRLRADHGPLRAGSPPGS